MNAMVYQEMKKVLEASFIQPIYYLEWLANIIPVMKNEWNYKGLYRLQRS